MSRTERERAPTFTVKPLIREEDDGNRLVLECELDSIPQPEIRWYKDEVPLVDGDDDRLQFRVRQPRRHHFAVSLIIDDVIELDAGVYRVWAKNLMGAVTASIRLNFDRKYRSLAVALQWMVIGYLHCEVQIPGACSTSQSQSRTRDKEHGN